MRKTDVWLMTDQKIDGYGQWLESRERSRETVKTYTYYLKQFKDFVGEEPVTKEKVLMWKTGLRDAISPVTINCALAALNGFFKYYGWKGCETRFLKISKSSFYPERKELTKQEYKRLVATAVAHGNERLALALETICSSGIRVSELSFITVAAIHKGQAEIECKGRIRTVLLTRQLCGLLKSYAAKRKISSGMIFVTKNGRALDRSNIWREMKALGKEADVRLEKIFPHNLRHLFARTYYEIEKNLAKLADILGHRDINTTRIYTKESGSQHRLQLEKMKLMWHDITEYLFCCTSKIFLRDLRRVYYIY